MILIKHMENELKSETKELVEELKGDFSSLIKKVREHKKTILFFGVGYLIYKWLFKDE